MAVVYATLIIKGRKTISDVPVKIKEQVKEILDCYAHIIGNGTNDTARSNAFTVDWSGNVIASGTTTSTQFKSSALNTAPTSATDTGTFGEIRITSGYIYVCVGTNTWVRSALTIL